MLLGQIIKDQSQNSRQTVKTIISCRPKPTIKTNIPKISKLRLHLDMMV